MSMEGPLSAMNNGSYKLPKMNPYLNFDKHIDRNNISERRFSSVLDRHHAEIFEDASIHYGTANARVRQLVKM